MTLNYHWFEVQDSIKALQESSLGLHNVNIGQPHRLRWSAFKVLEDPEDAIPKLRFGLVLRSA
jgi:hypothetical protein